MSKNVKAIIFDLDGVLLSTDKFHYLAWKKLADKLGIPFCEKDNEAFRGVGRMDCLEILLSKDASISMTDEEKIAAATEKNDYYREYLNTMTPDYVTDEVRNTLKALREKGCKLAVGSSSKNARFILAQTEMTDYFDAIADGNDIKNSKPDPEVFLTAARFVDTAPELCAVVEDAEAGLEAAVAAGMLPVAYASAYGSPLGGVQLERFADLLRLLA